MTRLLLRFVLRLLAWPFGWLSWGTRGIDLNDHDFDLAAFLHSQEVDADERLFHAIDGTCSTLSDDWEEFSDDVRDVAAEYLEDVFTARNEIGRITGLTDDDE